MGVPLGSAGAERDAELRPREMTSDPGQVSIGQREAGLAGAVPNDELERRGVPQLARLACFVGDDHDLEPATLRGGGDAAHLGGLLGGADQRHHAVDLVQEDPESVRIEL